MALKYRPRTFGDIVGQKQVQMLLAEMMKKDNIPHALLFDGSRGTGKTSSARILAAALNCEMDSKPCAQCPSCRSIYDGSSLDVLEIDAASNGRVEDIRGDAEKNKKGLREKVMYAVSGRTRVCILDEAQSMTKEAFNALLKVLEEPPPNVVFVLLTTEPNKILGTVVSRCMPFTFRRITVVDIVGRLKYICAQEGLKVDDDLLLMLAERANGGMRDAVMTMDQVTRAGINTAEQYAELIGETDFGPVLLKAMIRGNHAEIYGLVDQQMTSTGNPADVSSQLVSVLKDILVIKSNGPVIRQGKSLEERKVLASALELDRVMALMRVLWDVKTKVHVGEDQRSILDISIAVGIEALAGKRATPASSNGHSKQKLSLDAMRQLA